MTHLAQALKKYYRHEGNKIIFLNKYSLNQLAIQMWEKLGYSGIDASTLSRVINGDRLFTKTQLKVFCEVLSCDKTQEKKFFSALEIDILQRFHLVGNSKMIHTQLISKLLNTQLAYLKSLRERGQMELLLFWSDETIKRIQQVIATQKEPQNPYLSLLADVYFEKAYAYGCTLPAGDAFKSTVPLIKKQLRISERTTNPITFLKAKIISSYSYYSLGIYTSSEKTRERYLLKSLEEIQTATYQTNISEELKLMYLRCLNLSSMYLHDKQGFYQTAFETKNILAKDTDNKQTSYHIWALASVARGESLFLDSAVYKTLQTVEKLDQELSWKDPLRTCALLRNTLEVYDNLQKPDLAIQNEYARKGLQIASDYGYNRYQNYFKQYLKV